MHRLRFWTVLSVAVVASGCNDNLTIPNYNNPTTDAAARDRSSVQLLVNGIEAQHRTAAIGYILSTGILGREAYNYTPTEGRNTTHFLGGPGPLDYAGFANGNFAGPYGNARNIFNFLAVVEGAPLTAEQKRAAAGFAKTIEALEYMMIIATRDTIGAVVEIKANPTELAPFVSRDSAFRYVVARLDEARDDLQGGSAAFPFTLHAGYAGFTTPATFRGVNRAIAARALVRYASLGCGASCYQQALTALGESFLSLNAANLNVGPFHPYSTTSGDAQNTLFFSTSSDIVAHASVHRDAPLRASGARDLRLIAKADTNTPTKQPSPPGYADTTKVRYRLYADRSAPVKIIRNEELILLRAEARWFTGDKQGAIDDINFIRINSGGLAASALTTASSDAEFITELLLQRRYSLMFEGHRWVDHRRFGRLSALPLDRPTHWVAPVQPIPQSECLIRVNQTTPAMRGPGCP